MNCTDSKQHSASDVQSSQICMTCIDGRLNKPQNLSGVRAMKSYGPSHVFGAVKATPQ